MEWECLLSLYGLLAEAHKVTFVPVPVIDVASPANECQEFKLQRKCGSIRRPENTFRVPDIHVSVLISVTGSTYQAEVVEVVILTCCD